MKKLSFVLVVLGSGLAAFGFSGWQLANNPWLSGGEFGPGAYYTAGWTLDSRLEITVGVVLLVWGFLLQKHSN